MAETCRNLFVYPNLLLLDVSGLTIRTVWPVRPDYMELTAHALAPYEEGPERLRRRLENFNLFLGPGCQLSGQDIDGAEEQVLRDRFGCQERAYAGELGRGRILASKPVRHQAAGGRQ